MPKYLVMLEGENFPIRTDGKTDLLGFYTTRKVKASDPAEAEKIAVDLIRNDTRLMQAIDREVEVEPKIYMESISKLPWWKRTGGTGYTFFPMEEK